MTNTLNLGCGEDYHPDAINIDAVDSCNPDRVYDITNYPWPWDGIEEIRMFHVLEHLSDIERALEEAAKTLTEDGRTIVKLPMGQDAISDPDHSWGKTGNPWTWRTPEFYCGKRHWDVDVGLDLVERSIDLWSVHPSNAEKVVYQSVWSWKLNQYGPGEWCFSLPNSCGEFTVIFEK